MLLFRQCCDRKTIFLKANLHFLEKQQIYNSEPLICLTTTLPQNTYWDYTLTFWNFVFNWQPWQNFWGEKSFKREIQTVIFPERKIVESLNLVQLVFRPVKTFLRKKRRKNYWTKIFTIFLIFTLPVCSKLCFLFTIAAVVQNTCLDLN